MGEEHSAKGEKQTKTEHCRELLNLLSPEQVQHLVYLYLQNNIVNKKEPENPTDTLEKFAEKVTNVLTDFNKQLEHFKKQFEDLNERVSMMEKIIMEDGKEQINGMISETSMQNLLELDDTQ